MKALGILCVGVFCFDLSAAPHSPFSNFIGEYELNNSECTVNGQEVEHQSTLHTISVSEEDGKLYYAFWGNGFSGKNELLDQKTWSNGEKESHFGGPDSATRLLTQDSSGFSISKELTLQVSAEGDYTQINKSDQDRFGLRTVTECRHTLIRK